MHTFTHTHSLTDTVFELEEDKVQADGDAKPQIVSVMDRMQSETGRLVTRMHAAGINARYLPRLASAPAASAQLKLIVLLEMCVRAVKQVRECMCMCMCMCV
jgi:hypothetical protein